MLKFKQLSGSAKDKKTVNLLLRILISVLLLALGAIIHLFLNYYGQNNSQPIIVIISTNLANSLIIAGVFSFLWDYFVKRKLTEEIIETTCTPRDIIYSGLKQISFDYCEVNWKHLISLSRKQIDILFVIGESWATGYRLDIRQHLKKYEDSNFVINLFLADYNNPSVIDEILRRHGHSNSGASKMQRRDIVRSIGRTIEVFLEIKNSFPKASINVHLCNFVPVFSIYRFDDCMLIAFASHLKKAKVPHLYVHKNSDFYNFGYEQFETLLEDKVNVKLLEFDDKEKFTTHLEEILLSLNPDLKHIPAKVHIRRHLKKLMDFNINKSGHNVEEDISEKL